MGGCYVKFEITPRFVRALWLHGKLGSEHEEDRPTIKRAAEALLRDLYFEKTDNTRRTYPCTCRARLEVCDCEFQFRYRGGEVGARHYTGPKNPVAGARERGTKLPENGRVDRYDNDPVLRQHAAVAREGSRGRYAGARGERIIPHAEFNPHADNRASTRDMNRTAEEAGRELEKPYDSPAGVPKSWAIRGDAEPEKKSKDDPEKFIDDGVIVPPATKPTDDET